ncbi:dockerin type I domain-containing protein [Ruminococcus flavefaciens]|uniref:dockerin type I domain-containing protein n=1 Tax=Ruminococcus flavefaciens TaxID=1265 RepID=UPI0013DD58AC|nr:dockerin type I domain-containing protein [Ruminococcus flavefaciens]
MKFRKSAIAAVIAAAALCMTTAAPVSAATVTTLPSAAQVTAEEDIPFLTTEEAEKYFRQQVKAHTEHIELVITDYEGEDYQDIEDRLNNALLEFTGDPTEGAYLALQSNKNDGTIYQVVEGIYCDYHLEYLTTTGQEAEVTAEMAKLRETDGFRKAADSSVYDKLLWAYDYLIDQMVLDSDLIDDSLSSAYSALIGRKANEAGQIHLLIRLMEELGVEPMIYMTNFNSLTNEEVDVHYLCMAKIDGTYYFLDPIWDKKMGGNAHRFFLRGYSDLDSESDGSEEFTHVHIFSILGIEPEAAFADSEISASAYPAPEVSYALGDVTGDGAVNSIDASNVLAEYARLSSESGKGVFTAAQNTAGDVDKSGQIDAVDASKILSYYAYLSTTKEPMGITEFLGA